MLSGAGDTDREVDWSPTLSPELGVWGPAGLGFQETAVPGKTSAQPDGHPAAFSKYRPLARTELGSHIFSKRSGTEHRPWCWVQG